MAEHSPRSLVDKPAVASIDLTLFLSLVRQRHASLTRRSPAATLEATQLAESRRALRQERQVKRKRHEDNQFRREEQRAKRRTARREEDKKQRRRELEDRLEENRHKRERFFEELASIDQEKRKIADAKHQHVLQLKRTLSMEQMPAEKCKKRNDGKGVEPDLEMRDGCHAESKGRRNDRESDARAAGGGSSSSPESSPRRRRTTKFSDRQPLPPHLDHQCTQRPPPYHRSESIRRLCLHPHINSLPPHLSAAEPIMKRKDLMSRRS